MRTKTLVMTAAALVAGVLASSAQVYSANVVGYVNKTFPANAFALVCTPLDAGTNDLQTVLQNVPDTTTVWFWNSAIQDFDGNIPAYSSALQKWIPNAQITPGMGYFVLAAADFTNTYVGNVLQGTLTNTTPIDGNGSFSALGSMVPVSGSLTNTLAGYTPTDTDTIWTWNGATQDFDGNIPAYSSALGKWIPDISIPVGDGFFYLGNNATPQTWVRTFTVQ